MSTPTEQSRRRRVVYHALRSQLPSSVVLTAVSLCDREFANERTFSLTRFLNRLGQLDPSIGAPLRYFEQLQKLNSLGTDDIGPDPNELNAPRSGGAIRSRSASGWPTTAEALVREIDQLIVLTKPDLAPAWQAHPHVVSPTATKEQLHKMIHNMYIWLCQELGPVMTDKLFQRAVRAVEADPQTALHPPQGLL